ncbi:MAG TPA: hybrid sensor histidine kinase/response regulator [Leptolyngbyaceae cyanobacterium M33_DOE_097]|uniref:histidine kinase n=1 Tax=Oscillatoriales cyanobacterium SpSt-418 TaxID=2282169 RepID=A0A7C3KEE4_9CYAN|nr:hybrid sensor histidine kinase/response regulator [Leptolyngbyaceae cyanobacterium M33_DOE_097]
MSVPKILVVEDEVIVAKTIAGQLKQLGYIVVDTASSGMAAISKAAAAQPDLILMDIVLKGEMDGVAAATQIRAQRDVPIIYLTAYADDNTLQRATGEISGVVLVFRDMRDRRQAELLTQALEKEKELNQVKSQFISIVSHEFRNPLAVVRTAAELLEKGHDLPEQKKNSYIQRIKTSVRSMNDLMEDVLLMGQVEADRVTCNPTLLNLEQFCRNLVEEFSIVEGSLHTLIFNCQASCTDVWMDERILRYILSNLLSNAIKYSAAGTTVQLDLTVVPTEKLVIFQIRDEGIGIPEADQPRLFDSFFRASNVKSIQGTGLGLAIVKRCVEANRGEIQVSSQVGLGTTITVKLATLIETEEA